MQLERAALGHAEGRAVRVGHLLGRGVLDHHLSLSTADLYGDRRLFIRGRGATAHPPLDVAPFEELHERQSVW